MSWFLALRRSEIAVRQVIWNVIDALPLPVATKQRIAPYIQRENAQAQFVAIRSARAVLMGQDLNSSNPVVPAVMPATIAFLRFIVMSSVCRRLTPGCRGIAKFWWDVVSPRVGRLLEKPGPATVKDRFWVRR